MIITETSLKGCVIIEPEVLKDSRGYFYESFNQQKFNNGIGLDINFVQDNESLSQKGVLRGLHYQEGDYAQAKLVRVIKGKVLDVAVDIRKNSPTYGKHFSVILSEQNKKQLFIPRDFAHGFLVLEDNTLFSYKCDNYYNKESERGIIYNDESLKIDWGLPVEQLILSEKDVQQPKFHNP